MGNDKSVYKCQQINIFFTSFVLLPRVLFSSCLNFSSSLPSHFPYFPLLFSSHLISSHLPSLPLFAISLTSLLIIVLLSLRLLSSSPLSSTLLISYSISYHFPSPFLFFSDISYLSLLTFLLFSPIRSPTPHWSPKSTVVQIKLRRSRSLLP